MPKAFLDCIAKGGKVRTVSLPNGNGGVDFLGANVITSNSFNYQNK